MTADAQRMIEILVSREPAMRSAADIGREMQGRVPVEMKSHTGNLMADVVTEADRRVQQEILTVLAPTDLRRCTLLAEETPSGEDPRGAFEGSAGLYLTIDPIDGTKRFTEGKPWFSLIVGLHDGRRPLYTFAYYPRLDWWIRMAGDAAETSGPPLDLGIDASKVIVYTTGDPRTDVPGRAAALERAGYRFQVGEQVSECGSKYLFLSGLAAGYYSGNPNLYDGLFGLHYALCHGLALEARGRDGGPMDLTQHEPSKWGLRYPGYYIVLPPGIT
ncbi:MAG: hypothetical protein FJX76_26570 [Armatimonadetes bacterium]|nr:hypothetical protein [Armatimonadota bacterium]